MTVQPRPLLLLAHGLALALALGACRAQQDDQKNLDALDAELTNSVAGNGRDPVLASALNDPIMVDPALIGQANDDAVRPPAQPLAGPVPPATPAGDGKRPAGLWSAPAATGDCPQCRAARASLTLGALAQHGGGNTAACAPSLRYSAGWATRLPAALPLYPDARLLEAAGTDAAGCSLRAVSFESAAAVPNILDFYYTQARKAGYDTGHQADGAEHVLAGTKGDAAFTVFVTARAGGGSAVDVLANGGR